MPEAAGGDGTSPGTALARLGLRWRPSPLRPAREMRRQRRQLRRLAGWDGHNAPLWAARLAQLEAQRYGVADMHAPDDTLSHHALGRAWQAALTRLVHPAASWLPPRRWALRQHADLIEAGLAQGWAERTTFLAADAGAALLDGLRIGRDARALGAPRPQLMVVPGFAMTYEAIVPQCRAIAQQLDVVVVLHNSRGVGRSLGRQTSIAQAIDDARAVLCYLLRAGHRRLAGYGISMGSATLVGAVRALEAAGELPPDALGLVALVRAPSSIPRVVGAHLGGPIAGLAAALLRGANLPAMDSVAMLQRPLPTDVLMVTTAADDGLVCGDGQLARALGAPDGLSGPWTLPSGQHACLVAGHGRGHVDRAIAHPLHDAALAAWACRAGDADGCTRR